LNPLDEANDFPVPNVGVVLEEIAKDVENVGGAMLNVHMIEYPVENVVEIAVVEENERNDGDIVENEGNEGGNVVNEGNECNVVNEENLVGGEGNIDSWH
jgi:hypothetical protein